MIVTTHEHKRIPATRVRTAAHIPPLVRRAGAGLLPLATLVILTLAAQCAFAAGLASSDWPMFHHDTLHTGNAQQPGPSQPQIRWFQGGAAILPFESSHVPHGPQGAIWSSTATSEVSSEVGGAKKVWYFHNSTWTGRTPLIIRSEFPSSTVSAIPISAAPTEVLFETSASMQFVGATPDQANTLLFRNRDPNNNLIWVKQTDGSLLRQMRIPAGFWTFDFWITNVPAATNINFTVYSFAHATPDTRVAITGLNPVSIPIPQTPDGTLRRIEFVQTVDDDVLLDPESGVAIGVSVAAGSASLVVGGRALSRVETPIDVPAVYAGADDGSVWAFDASTGNVLWSYAVAGAMFRSSPAAGDDGTVYIGSLEGTGHDLGRLYAFNPNGTLKWTYPAVTQSGFFRSGFLTPDDPANFPPNTAPLYFMPGSGTDANPPTIAQTGTEATGKYVQLVPRTTNSTVINSPPSGFTDAGWLFQINPQSTALTLQSGSWTLDLTFRALALNTQDAFGFIAYRISKVTVVAGSPPTLQVQEELLGWTQDTERLRLPAGGRVFVHIETPTVTAAQFAQGEYIFIELLVRQVVSTGSGSGGWQLLLEGEDSFGGSDTRLTTPALSQAAISAISDSPVISGDDVVYIATHGGEVHAVEAVDGQARWATALRENNLADEIRSSPALSSSGKVYVGSMNGRLYALDGNDGAIVWRFPLSGQAALGPIESSPALDEGRNQIYFGSDDGKVYAVQPVQTAPNTITPQLQWSFATAGEVIATPAIAPDGTIYVGSLDHNMYALKPGDGTLLSAAWPFTTNAEIQSSAAITSQRWNLFFVDQPVGVDPTRLHLSSAQGANPTREISQTFENTGASERVIELKFDQEFRTDPLPLDPELVGTLPQPLVLPAGIYQITFFGRANLSSGEDAALFFKIFPGGSTTPIMTFPATPITTTATPGRFVTSLNLTEAITLSSIAPSNYLRVEVWGRATVAPSSTVTIHFDFDGGSPSGLETPVQLLNTVLVYFATTAARVVGPPPQVLPQGRVHCLQVDAVGTGVAIWIDPIDGLPGFNPHDTDPTSALTVFTASPAAARVVGTVITRDEAGVIVQQSSRLDPVVYLGGNDGVMYAFGRPSDELFPPATVVPPPVVLPSVLTLAKQADRDVADIGQTITYTLRYRNDSSLAVMPAIDATISDPLPVGVDFVSASDGGILVGSVVTWTAAGKPELAAIWPQDTGQVSFTVTVRSDVNIVPPLEPPSVIVSYTDPVTQGVNAPQPTDFLWGQMLYVFLAGRGKPAIIINSATTDPAIITATSGEQAVASPVTVYAGWGKRYRLTFTYGPANDPVPGSGLENQPIIYTTEIVLTGTGQRSGRPEEAYEYEDLTNYPDPRPEYAGQALGLTVFKIQLSPRGYAYSPNAAAMTESPNRPWTPYYWRVAAQQNRGGTPGREEWGPYWEPARTEPYDFMIHNPLEVNPATFSIAAGATINPGTQTDNRSFTLWNVSQQAITGTGPVYPRNVIRWDKVDLAQSGPVYNQPGYEFRDENYLPDSRIRMSPSRRSLGPGQANTVTVWASIPNYLSPGIYQAPNANPLAPTSDLPIYVDLNGNGMWDPGEAKFENEFDFDGAGQLVAGDLGPFVVTASVSLEPWLRFGADTVDVTKAAPGTIAGAPTPPLLNIGNVDLASITLDSRYIDPDSGLPSPLLPLERSDLTGISRLDWRETRPLYWDVSAITGAIAKTPVGSQRPNQQWLLLTDPPVAHDQPSGAYSGSPDAVSAVSSVVTRAGAPFKVRVVERRVSGYDAGGQPLRGTDVDPFAAWVDPDTLRVLWSSNRRADGAAPTASDPYLLRYGTLDRAGDTWTESASGYPAAAGDPMDTPAAEVPKAHSTPGYAIDADGTGWLFWGGSVLRATATGGHVYDNRLLWTSGWPLPGSADAIEDDPDVSGPTGNAANMSGIFRLQPRPVFWNDGTNEYNFLVFSEQSTTQPWRLMVRGRGRALGGAWSAWAQQPLPTSSGLTAARDPSAFHHNGLLWVVFSGASAYHGNYDIYCARYDPATIVPVAFARVTGETLTPDAARRVFVSRHKDWVVSVRSDVAIYVGGVEIGGTLGAYDATTGRYPISGGTYSVEFNPALGTVYFSAVPPAAVTADYTPSLLRLTASPADDSNPSAFMETYRYLDGTGAPQPNPYAPRLYVVWTQAGTITGGAEIMYVTMRESSPSNWGFERQPRVVPVDHVANEFGLCAVKDPRYAQVWLLWSSTRGAPTTGAQAAADCDIYYQAFDPELP